MGKLSLRHTKVGREIRVTLVVDDSMDLVTMTEETWNELERQHAKYIRPINEKRVIDRENKERQEHEAERRKNQRVEEIAGRKFRIQATSDGRDIEAWLNAFDRKAAPFALDLDRFFATQRPWVIKGRKINMRHDGEPYRLTVCDRGNHERRFGSLEAAAKKALELQAAGEFLPPQERQVRARGTA